MDILNDDHLILFKFMIYNNLKMTVIFFSLKVLLSEYDAVMGLKKPQMNM